MDTGKSALGLDGNVAARWASHRHHCDHLPHHGKGKPLRKGFMRVQSILLHVAFIIVAIAVWTSDYPGIAGIAASAATNSGALGGVQDVRAVWLAVIAPTLVD